MNIRTFDQLTIDEQAEAMEKLYLEVMADLVTGKKTPITSPYAEQYALLSSAWGPLKSTQMFMDKLVSDSIMDEWIAETASFLAVEATYIPDDGSMVVRL